MTEAMIYRCQILSKTVMVGKKVEVFYKVDDWNSPTPNHLEVQHPFVSYHFIGLTKNQYFLDVEEINKYNYDDKLDRPAHKEKYKMPMLMRMGRQMVQEGRVFFKDK